MSADLFSAYGSAPAGEHFAILRTTSNERYPAGYRFVVGFIIVDPETKVPREDPDGHPLFAVAVCNQLKKGTAKSKQFKLRKALLTADEFDPIVSATSVPDWSHFTKRLPDGSWRVVRIRVANRGENGKSVSVVTHIQRPRDGVWESIEGKFDGPPFPWINLDGTLKRLKQEQVDKLPRVQRDVYERWDCSPRKGKPWFVGDGHFLELPAEEVAKLDKYEKTNYEIAKIKHQLACRKAGAASMAHGSVQ
jgi:hypothetical protein